MLDCDNICANYGDDICKACLEAAEKEKNEDTMKDLFEYKGYYQDFLDSINVDLKNHFKLADKISLNISEDMLVHYFNKQAESYKKKHYQPRPFHPASDMLQAVCLQEMGYCEENTKEKSTGLAEIDNAALKRLIGNDNFKKLGLDPATCAVRMLEYTPGTGIPLHTDSFGLFKTKYGDDDRLVTRYFIAVSSWDWGHMLQVHDNVITHWSVGDAYEIPEGIFHLSSNFGIANKYTLTVTGFVDE